MLDDVLAVLACPHCSGALTRTTGALRCTSGHSFDVARQGYVSLLGPERPAGAGDTAGMVGARRAFLDAGHYEPLARAVASVCTGLERPPGPRFIADLGAGTGYFLRRAMGNGGDVGLALDLSPYASRWAARAHPRIGVVRCDLWAPLPVRSARLEVVMSVLAPRNGEEMRRVLRADGAAVVVTPTRRHLAELVGPLGLLHVDPRKAERVAAQLDPHLVERDRHTIEVELALGHAAVTDLVAMGPSAWHTAPDAMAGRITALPELVAVTASFSLGVYQPRLSPARA